MKPIKSIVLLAAGVLAFSACDKKNDNQQTSATGAQDTTIAPGNAGTDQNGVATGTATTDATATGTETTNAAATTSPTNTTDTDTAVGAGTGAAVGAGAAAGAGAANMDDSHDHADHATSEGSGAVSDEAATDDSFSDDEFAEDTEVQEEEYLGDDLSDDTGMGTGSSSENMEYVDETSSEPDNVRGGRDARMVPRENELDNTSSEPDTDTLRE